MGQRLCVLVVASALLAAPAAAQLIAERIEGARRFCVYGGSGSLSGGGTGIRAHSVGLGESCPSTPPPPATNFSAPPSAPLISDIPNANGRSCIYEQANQQWAFSLPLERPCPLAAGMLVDERGRLRSR